MEHFGAPGGNGFSPLDRGESSISTTRSPTVFPQTSRWGIGRRWDIFLICICDKMIDTKDHGDMKTCVYIDGANLHKGIASLGWRLDYPRFRSWIRQKYEIETVKLFIGIMPDKAHLYTFLQRAGYQLVFKEVLYTSDGHAKGNCDADLVLQATRDYFEQGIQKAILVSSDGDYAPLIKFWQEKGVDCTIMSPAIIKKCSWLLRKTNAPLVALQDVKEKIQKAV